MFKTSYLVILFDKKPELSLTLNTILSSDNDYTDCSLVVWSNGPKSIKNELSYLNRFKEIGFSVDFYETTENESLAKIYNYFIDNYDSERYVLLDDDSTLNSDYLIDSMNSNPSFVSVPLIKHGGEIEGPILNGKICTQLGLIPEEQRFVAIGSGLIIGKDLVRKVKQSYSSLFDENFYLYAVDSTFFYRLFNIGANVDINVIDGFEHSLSRLNKDSDPISRFRKKERTYAILLTALHYSKYPKLKIIKLILIEFRKLILRTTTELDLRSSLFFILNRKHYRYSTNKDVTKIEL
ncbi:glycosyltransferase family 2 protein [Vibrio natriegens]|uniref:glycosyltransferase family 2 protein n=1 Tax=Vibrio natriegens TaxID=691 RepID=UPI00390A0457